MVKVIRHDGTTATTRFGVALITALLITMVLLFLMQVLIATGKSAVVENRVGDLLEFVRVPKAPTPVPPKETRSKPKPPAVQPPTPQINESFVPEGGTTVYVPPPTISVPGPEGPLVGGGVRAGDLLPIVKVQPLYPRTMAARGIEGHVILEYTVTRQGAVANVVVVESSHRGFESAAISSAMKYKYKPRFINGEPVAVHGVQTLIRFQLED